MTNKNILIIIGLIVLILGGVILGLSLKPKPQSESPLTEGYIDVIFEEITTDYNSLDFMDKRLIAIKPDGGKVTIIPKMREFLKWEKISGEATYFPRKVSFSPTYQKVFFAKHLGGTGHSAGFFSLDLKTLVVEELSNTGEIYQNYLNYLSIVSADGTKIASLGYDSLYLLDILNDEVKLLVRAKDKEVLFAGQAITDFVWLDSNEIQYPVYSQDNLEKPIVTRKTTLEALVKEEQKQLDSSNWKTHRNEKYGFEIKYPPHYRISDNRITLVGKSIISNYSAIDFDDTTGIRPLYVGKVIDLNNIKAMELPLGGNIDGGIDFEIGFNDFPSQGKSFRILFTTNQKGLEPKIQEFRQILSTFRFIEPRLLIDTSGWKIYHNEKLGFSFYYPPDLPEDLLLDRFYEAVLPLPAEPTIALLRQFFIEDGYQPDSLRELPGAKTKIFRIDYIGRHCMLSIKYLFQNNAKEWIESWFNTEYSPCGYYSPRGFRWEELTPEKKWEEIEYGILQAEREHEEKFGSKVPLSYSEFQKILQSIELID